MTITRFLGGAMLAVTLAAGAVTGASAQAAGSPISPERAALARQIIEASGGLKQIDTLMDTVFKAADAAVGSSLPPEQKRLQSVLQQKMIARFKGLEPQMIEAMVKVYADNLTDKELRDALAYMQSETGQAMARKMPQITAQTMQVMIPMMTTTLVSMKQDIIETACEEAHCTADDRAKVTAAMDKAFGKQSS